MKDKIQAAEYHRTILDLTTPFDLAKLRKTYHSLMKVWHPDRFSQDIQNYLEATEKAKDFNLAFEYLSELLDELGGSYHYSSASTASNRRLTGHIEEPVRYEPAHTYDGEEYSVGFPDATVTEIFVKSSHIISTGYNHHTRILFIKFKRDDVYKYFDVPLSLFENFLEAESHGKFAHQNIYHAFQYERCS